MKGKFCIKRYTMNTFQVLKVCISKQLLMGNFSGISIWPHHQASWADSTMDDGYSRWNGWRVFTRLPWQEGAKWGSRRSENMKAGEKTNPMFIGNDEPWEYLMIGISCYETICGHRKLGTKEIFWSCATSLGAFLLWNTMSISLCTHQVVPWFQNQLALARTSKSAAIFP